jgi:UDP-N-acetylmuramoyl-tripeptide--D-alanyl-D-alanine ligase
MIALTAEEAGRALGLVPLEAPVPGVSVDSRSIRTGELFVALRGDRFDGHDFVDAAFDAGASGAVVERHATAGGGGPAGGAAPRLQAGWPVYEVEDSLEALWALAREVRRKSKATVFAVTGSVGKTSTKDLLGAMVGRVRRVVTTVANQNNEVGVPLTLLAIEPETEAVIVEMGMRGRGQIAALARVAEPDVGVITNIHPVHLELLGTLESIAEAKAELVRGLRPGGVAVVPAECALLQPYVADARRRLVTCSADAKAEEADVTASLEARENGSGHAVSLRWPGGEAEIETPYIPWHGLANVAAAAAACYAAGLPVGECAKGIAAVQFTGGRGDVMRLPGLCVIDDTYNANPVAVRAALDNLVRVAAETGSRPVAVLGDMLELGVGSEGYHRETGAYAADIGVRALWGVGRRARAIGEGFQERWEAKPDTDVEWTRGDVGSAEETSLIVAGLRRGDVVLFKASRSMRLEIMVRRVADEAEAGRWEPTFGFGPGREDGTKEKR